MKASWRTTTFGLMAALGYAVGLVAGIPHWLKVACDVSAAAGLAGLGFFSRDDKVTSEQAGADGRETGVPWQRPLLILAVAGLVLLPGCVGPNRTAYRSVAISRVSVHAALELWDGYVESGRATIEQEEKVKAAYELWQSSMKNVCNAGAIYSAAVTTNATGATGAQAALETAIATAAQRQADLLSLITQIKKE